MLYAKNIVVLIGETRTIVNKNPETARKKLFALPLFNYLK
jgi:hypothetical protein